MVDLSKIQAARRAGVEERRNETLPRNEPRPWLGQAERELPGKVYRDCCQPETNRRVVARHGAGRDQSHTKTKKISPSGAAGRMPWAYSAHLLEKQGEYHPICADILPVFCPFRLKRGLFQWLRTVPSVPMTLESSPVLHRTVPVLLHSDIKSIICMISPESLNSTIIQESFMEN